MGSFPQRALRNLGVLSVKPLVLTAEVAEECPQRTRRKQTLLKLNRYQSPRVPHPSRFLRRVGTMLSAVPIVDGAEIP